MTSPLETVVDDILIRIIGILPLDDVLSVRQTSKRLGAITRHRTVWHYQFCFQILSKGLPIPGTPTPVPEISALDLEWRTRLAVHVRNIWTRPAGPLLAVSSRNIPAAQQVALRIGGRELLTLHTGKFITWRLNEMNKPAAENIMHEQLLGADSTWKIYKDCGGSDTVAIINSSGDAFILRSSFESPPLQRHYPGRILGLFGQFVLVSTTHEPRGSIDIYNWVPTSSKFATIELNPFGKHPSFAEFDSHLLVLWEACLEIYSVPAIPGAGQSTVLKPIQMFFLPFPVQAPVVHSPCTPLNPPNGGFAFQSNSKDAKALSICYHTGDTGEIRGSILSRGGNTGEEDPQPFRLARNSFIAEKDCVCMRVGHSGRGLWLDSDNNVYRCNTVSTVSSWGDEFLTLDMGQRGLLPLCRLQGVSKVGRCDRALDFDEGTGRIVYCDEEGLVSVVDMV